MHIRTDLENHFITTSKLLKNKILNDILTKQAKFDELNALNELDFDNKVN